MSVFEAESVRGVTSRSGDQWNRPDVGWRLALWLMITLRVGLGLIAVLSLQWQHITRESGVFRNLIIPGSGFGTLLLSSWQRFDALWYQQIAEHGYHAGEHSLHFPPLFPLLSRIVSFPIGGQIVPAELLVSSAAFVVAMGMLYKLARLEAGPRAAELTVLLTAFFPVGFYLVAPYTESLYLALTLAVFWFARQGRPGAAGLAAFAAGLTRTFAIFLVLPLAYEYLRRRRERGTLLGWGLLSAVSPLVAVVATQAYGRLVVGEPQPFSLLVNRHFHDHVAFPWQTVWASWTHITATGAAVEILNLVSLLGFTILAILAVRRLPLSYGLYSLPYVGFLYWRESFTPLAGDARYMLVVFPCFLMLALLLSRHLWLAGGVLIVSLLLQAQLFIFWVHFGSVG